VSRPAVLITGAARRIGRTIAEVLAAAGWPVCLHYHHSAQEAQALADQLQQAYGVACGVVQADLGRAQEAASLIERACQAMGTEITHVVNNASVFSYDALETLTPDHFDEAMRVNLLAPVLIAQGLQRRKPAQACIVNILDQKIYNLNPDFFSYTISKQALAGATELLARTVAPIRVCGIAPGISLPSADQTAEEFSQIGQYTPLGKTSTPLDIAHTVKFIFECESITGQIITVDGGQHMLPLPRDVMFVQREKS
jgi:NAD(P)-dependent dehydrogenase (short-subunit alcohol dehydrogenase family)